MATFEQRNFDPTVFDAEFAQEPGPGAYASPEFIWGGNNEFCWILFFLLFLLHEVRL